MAEWGTPATVIAFLTVFGVGTILPKVVAALWQWSTGGEQRKRNEVERLRVRLAECQAIADDEMAHRRVLQESLSEHRIVAVNHGIPIHELPPFPGKPTKKKDDEE